MIFIYLNVIDRQRRSVRIGCNRHIDRAGCSGGFPAIAFRRGRGDGELKVDVAVGRCLDLQISELRRVNTGDTVGDGDDRAVRERQRGTLGNAGDFDTQCLGAVRVGEGRRDTQRNRRVFGPRGVIECQRRRLGDFIRNVDVDRARCRRG